VERTVDLVTGSKTELGFTHEFSAVLQGQKVGPHCSCKCYCHDRFPFLRLEPKATLPATFSSSHWAVNKWFMARLFINFFYYQLLINQFHKRAGRESAACPAKT